MKRASPLKIPGGSRRHDKIIARRQKSAKFLNEKVLRVANGRGRQIMKSIWNTDQDEREQPAASRASTERVMWEHVGPRTGIEKD